MGSGEKGRQTFLTGYKPAVRARTALMLGIRQPLDGPVFEKLGEAQVWAICAMGDHYDRGLGMSDATIESFVGMVNCCGPPLNTAQVRDIERICEEVARERLLAQQESER